MKKFSFIILLFVFTLSKTYSQKVKSKLFGKCGKRYFACYQILIKSDSTFEKYVFMDVGGGKVYKGKWERVKNDTIKLNTFKQPQVRKTYHIEEFDSLNSDSETYTF